MWEDDQRYDPHPPAGSVEAPRAPKRHFDHVKAIAKVNPKVIASIQELCKVRREGVEGCGWLLYGWEGFLTSGAGLWMVGVWKGVGGRCIN